jgi:Fe-S cluster biogenesis protein NfuA
VRPRSPTTGRHHLPGFKEGIVYLHMKGACSGCPSSTATLRHGIQNLLKHYVPEVVEVRPVLPTSSLRGLARQRALARRSFP